MVENQLALVKLREQDVAESAQLVQLQTDILASLKQMYGILKRVYCNRYNPELSLHLHNLIRLTWNLKREITDAGDQYTFDEDFDKLCEQMKQSLLVTHGQDHDLYKQAIAWGK